jgi:hypothetical protein
MIWSGGEDKATAIALVCVAAERKKDGEEGRWWVRRRRLQ